MLNLPLIESPFFAEVFPASTDPELLRVAKSLHEDGYAIIDFPEAEFDAIVDAIQHNLTDRYEWEAWRSGQVEGLRIQDAWQFDENVKRIAANAQLLQILSALYGKEAFPFQSLNFPVGTQQHYHTDAIHFSSIPERYMCGVWVAFEDVHPDAGPLIYYPGSHKLPIYLNEHLGTVPRRGIDPYGTYHEFVAFWQRLVEIHHLEPIEFLPKKGQALIWTTNLLHGGAYQRDKTLTRWSQVTHYYFKGCAYYTPIGSLPFLGSIEYKTIVDISTGQPVHHEINGIPVTPEIRSRLDRSRLEPTSNLQVPHDFDEAMYLALNPDVAAAGIGAKEHYLGYGIREGRRYKTVG